MTIIMIIIKRGGAPSPRRGRPRGPAARPGPTYMCVYTYISINIYIYIHICMYVYIYIYICAHMYIYIYIHIHIHIYCICMYTLYIIYKYTIYSHIRKFVFSFLWGILVPVGFNNLFGCAFRDQHLVEHSCKH